MRRILREDEIVEIIKQFPANDMPWIENDRERQKVFRDVLLYGNSKDIINLTRAIYLHKKMLNEKRRNLHISDERFLKDAERMIFDEIAYVMKIERNQVLGFITDNMNNG